MGAPGFLAPAGTPSSRRRDPTCLQTHAWTDRWILDVPTQIATLLGERGPPPRLGEALGTEGPDSRRTQTPPEKTPNPEMG